MNQSVRLQKQIQQMFQASNRQGAYVPGADWYEFKVTPTCPPSKRLQMRGGLGYFAYQAAAYADYNYRCYTVPDKTVDLADDEQVAIDVGFTNANWYKCYVLLLALPATGTEPAAADWSFVLWGDEVETETATEAESHMAWDTLVQSHPWKSSTTTPTYHGYPLAGIILRNNGTVGAGCPILAIDRLNRGRSYLWPADVRPRWYIAR